MVRCINLDWLEVYCLEDYIGYPHDAEYFRRQGCHVVEREYGTPSYHEMFTVYGRDDQPLLEIRRRPKSAKGLQQNGVLEPMACHVRLVNRACYFKDAAGMLQQFLEQHNLCYQRISRVDVALDFELFDSKDRPDKFIQRYMQGAYAKINQANISAHGTDSWNGRVFNSLKWGQPKSMVTTKLYCKSLELKQKHDKPYIRQAWQACNIVDDCVTMTKFEEDGTSREVDVWRVEFSIKSGTKSWFRMEDHSTRKKQKLSVRNDLPQWRTREQMWHIFISLCQCYFHFKHVEYKNASKALTKNALSVIAQDVTHKLANITERELQRKDRCRDKILFYASSKERQEFYKLGSIDTNTVPPNRFKRLLTMLIAYEAECVRPDVYKACEMLIEQLQSRLRTESMTYPWPSEEIQILQEVLAINTRQRGAKVTPDEVRKLRELQNLIFNENYDIEQ